MSDVATVLNKAADLIEQRGLYKGSFASRGRNCSYCTEGAIMVAGGFESELSGDGFLDEPYNLFSAEALISRREDGVVHDAIVAVAKKVGNPVPKWNDDARTTQDDVVRVLREVAAKND